MTIMKVYNLGIINYDTEVIIRDSNLDVVACGGWFDSGILRHVEDEITSFTWQDDHKVYFDIKS